MNKTDREIDRVLLDVILLDGEQDEAPDLSDMATRAKAILAKRDEERRRSRRGPSKVLTLGRMKPTSEDLDRRTAETRRRVARRCEDLGSVGELCGKPLDMATAQFCHLDGGSGKRRQEQWEGNTVMEHEECHTGPHGFDVTPREWIGAVKRWSKRTGYPVPARFRRLEIKAQHRAATEARKAATT